MKKQIDNVRDFHTITKNDWLATPKIPAPKRTALRTHLIMEEAHEFELAVKNKDFIEMADGLIDLLYVTFGSLGELGLGDIAEELFAEVHRSNMSKACKSKEEALETIDWYHNREDENKCAAAWTFGPNGTFLVYRISDGKTLKNKNYSPADLASIIRKAQIAT